MNDLFRYEKTFQNVSSEQIADNYIKKFSRYDANNGLEKFQKKFEIINAVTNS